MDESSDQSTSKEVELLSRVAANHLFLAQFEPLRAILVSLRNRDPERAASILKTIVLKGGRFDGVLWSRNCSSPPQLAWMALQELEKMSDDSCFGGIDRDLLRLKVEFLLLAQTVCSCVQEKMDGGDQEKSSGMLDRVRWILELGFRGLKSDEDIEDEVVRVDGFEVEEVFSGMREVILDQADVFDALCWNIHRQVHLRSDALEDKLAVGVSGFLEESAEILNGKFDAYVQIVKAVQMVHLNVLKEYTKSDNVDKAILQIRYLHPEFGLEELEYRIALKPLIEKVWREKSGYEEAQNLFQKKMLLVYVQSLSANSIKLTHIIQAIQDALYRDEIENNQYILSKDHVILLPLKKYLTALKLAKVKGLDDQTSQCMRAHSCIKDMYQYARVSGEHILESVTQCALSSVKKEDFQEACDVLLLFPPLQPLVVAMGWDLLSGKTVARRRLLLYLWTNKSQTFRPEESSMHKKQSNEMSCIEYLCDFLCFHMDLASFVAHTNSGHPWNSKDSMVLSRKQQIAFDEVSDHADEFVENFVLERLVTQTPLRVLFDVVPGLKFQDAIELIRMQPTNSTTMSRKRVQDIELIHVRYALESAVLALGTMEKCVDDEKDGHYIEAMWHLQNLRTLLASVSNIPRKVFTLSIVVSILYMDLIDFNLFHCTSFSSYSAASGQPDVSSSSEDGKANMVLFSTLLLDILHCSVQDLGVEWQLNLHNDAPSTGKEAMEWRVTRIKNFIEDWKWRLSILQNLLPLSSHSWSWKEALVVLRASPFDLLNICIQRTKYDIKEEVAHWFSLSLEDKASLELTGWVKGTFRRIQAEYTEAQTIEGFSDVFQKISSICSKLCPLTAVLLCIDIAVTSAKTSDACLQLLNEAGKKLSKIYPGESSKIHSAYWDHLSEVAMISVIRRVLRHLFDLLEQEKVSSLQEMFTGESSLSPFKESHKQRQHAMEILHQIIDDAHKGKRQFLSGKLHNLSRVFVDEEIDSEKRKLPNFGKGVLGLGFKYLRSGQKVPVSGEDHSQFADIEANDCGQMLISPTSSKPSTYISAFIIYIATIGNIVDGIDTTHDFNFFSLVYEWPKDLLTRLVFERGSTDAAAKIADITCFDFVHEVITACVPPVFPPHYGRGWANIPFIPSLSSTTLEKSTCKETIISSSSSSLLDVPVFSLKLDIVKHLAKSSPVRAILACVFGSKILSSGRLSSKTDSSNVQISQIPDAEEPLYEFALDQSERFPTLNRWIKLLPNSHRLTDSATLGVLNAKGQAKTTLKRSRESESDMESDSDDIADGNPVCAFTCRSADADHTNLDSIGSQKSHFLELCSTSLTSLDWENEGPYEEAVERLICEGNLKDALAISDRFLHNGASDHLLQLLIERGEEIHSVPGQPPSDGAYKMWTNNWKYCLRLKDKHLAAKLALKYMHHWEFTDAMDVLTMCLCHLPQSAPIRNEVLKMRRALNKYNHILLADDGHGSWQGVETEYKNDPEGLALKLAGRGAVSASLEVAESASLSTDLRRELQGRQLVNLLTADPLSGGGPAQASKFLSSLPDPNDALPVAMSAMQLLPDLHSKQLIVHFFLKRRSGNLSDIETSRLNSWALGLHVLAELPLPWQQRCSALHEHPQLILEVLLMMKQLQYASLLLKKFPSLRNDNLILIYAAKAIAVSVNSTTRESKTSLCDSRTRQKRRMNSSPKSNFTNSLSNLQKEARKAFSWALDGGNRGSPKDSDRKKKGSGLMSSERATCEVMVGNQEEHTVSTADGQERTPFVPTAEEWVLTGDATKDDAVRSVHKYESAPDIVLFKGLLSLCSDELVSAKAAMELCITQMKSVLSSQKLSLHASMEAISQAYHATESFALGYAKNHLKKITGISDMSSNSGSRDEDNAPAEASSSNISSQSLDKLSDMLVETEIWLGRAELLQSLLGSGIIASLDDIIDKDSSVCLRDRLIKEELYSMAVYSSKKCKVDVFPVWNAWGHALIRMELYAQARGKFKQALQLHKADPTVVIREIINTLESHPPIDAASVRRLYEHLVKSTPRIFDNSLTADAYLHVLYMPSTFPHTERSGLFHESTNRLTRSYSSDFEDVPRSNLDAIRYVECIYYFQEYDRPHMLQFMFQHGRYTDACLLFFPPNAVPLSRQPMITGPVATSPQRQDLLTTDYGSIEDLCGYCIDYDAMSVLEDILSARTSTSYDAAVTDYIASCLSRICNYCELHKHFNFLYKFQVIRRDHVGAGLCCIQLFMNSFSQEEAVKHLENAEMHFDEELSERSGSHGIPKTVSNGFRGKGVFGKFTEEGLLNLNACVGIQVDVIRSFNDTEGPQWTHSLFGNPNDADTFRRRCQIAETLAEKNFDLAFGVICRFNLPAVDIYAAVAAALADKKQSHLLTLLLKNIKRTIDHDDWDQVLGAAINVYANKHKERPDKLIDMLNSSHRKVLACVVCGRLKSAFQIASRSGSVADVQYVAHQALHANALPVLDMCKQWLAQYS